MKITIKTPSIAGANNIGLEIDDSPALLITIPNGELLSEYRISLSKDDVQKTIKALEFVID